MTRQRVLTLQLFALVLAGAAIAAKGDTVTFNSDPTGTKANGFTSVDSNLVHFSDSIASNLETGFAGLPESNGTNALAIFGDDASKLLMTFDVYCNALSLDFGNDNPGFVLPGDYALLNLFNGATLVGSAFTPVNADDLMNQSVAYSGVAFNNAEFYYSLPNGTPIGLIELVDNIAFTPVPEPATLLTILIGLGLGIAARRRGAV